ncbi:MAG: hypothetical protein RIA10_08130 [Amphiplicatus sp.]
MSNHFWRMAPLAALIGAASLIGCGNAQDAERTDKSGAVYGKPQGGAPDEKGQERATEAKKTEAKKTKNDASSYGDNILSYPDDLQMTMLAYRLTDRTPPLEAWAGEERDVRYADEFTKVDKLKAETQRLVSIYESTKGVGALQMRLNSQLSQYDSSKGGYYLTAFSPGGSFNFNGKESVSVQLDNMADAFFWPMDAEEAQEILAHTSRRVSINATIRITGAMRRTSGIVIKGDIADYAIYSERYNDERQLAAFSLE